MNDIKLKSKVYYIGDELYLKSAGLPDHIISVFIDRTPGWVVELQKVETSKWKTWEYETFVVKEFAKVAFELDAPDWKESWVNVWLPVDSLELGN